MAHVTPSRDANCAIIGYHSNRRVPDSRIVTENIIPLYQTLLAEETSHPNSKDGMHAASDKVAAMLADRGVAYDEFVATL